MANGIGLLQNIPISYEMNWVAPTVVCITTMNACEWIYFSLFYVILHDNPC